MKITAIQASPHRGNTYRRVEHFREKLQELGNFEFDHIELAKIDLGQCKGCFSCFLNGIKSCPLNDDALELLEKLRESDAVILATPVYSMHVSYLMKTFVDRFAFLFHRPEFSGKHAVGIAVTGGVGLKETLGYIEMFSGSWGFNWVDELRYVDSPEGLTLPRLSEEKDRSEIVAAKLTSVLESDCSVKPSLKNLLHFHIMRTVYGRMEQYLPRDHSFWKSRGWLNRKSSYFLSEAKTGFFKPLIPRAAAYLMGKVMDIKMKNADKSTERH